MDDNTERPPPERNRRNLHLGAMALLTAFFLLLLTSFWIGRQGLPGFDPRNRPETLLAGDTTNTFSTLPRAFQFEGELSPEQLAFGERQVERMAQDRPEMTRYVSNTDEVWQFCVRAMAGQAIGEPFLWENSLPDNDYDADHESPFEGQMGNIRIRKYEASGSAPGQPLSCERLWSCAVYEIENMRNHKAFMALYQMALKGKLTREEWTRENSRLEYEALRRTAKRYQELWCPLARQRNASSTPSLWGADIPATYERWILSYRDPNGYPWDAFARYYDREVVPYVNKTRGFP